MSNPESTLQQRLADIVGASADPFAKVASADPQLDAIAEATFEQAEETVEVPELLQPVEETTEEQPEAVAKEASVADLSVREIITSDAFQAGFRNAYAQRAGEIEDAIEKVAYMQAAKNMAMNAASKHGRSAAIGAGVGAGLNMARTAIQNRGKADEDKKSVLGAGAKGAAAGAVVGGAGSAVKERMSR